MRTTQKSRILSFFMAMVMVVTMLPVPTYAAEEHTHGVSGTVGDSEITWSFDESTGRLVIGGHGNDDPFQSAADQPWAEFREEITEVWFQDMAGVSIQDMAYWFEGCTSLTKAEIPYTTTRIGERAFANCPNLTLISFYYMDEDDPQITPGAFATLDTTEAAVETQVGVISEHQIATHQIFTYIITYWKSITYLNSISYKISFSIRKI